MDDLLGIGKVVPIDKLFDTISKAIGRVFKPYFDRKDIDNKAYELKKRASGKADELKIIASVINETSLPEHAVEYKDGEFSITNLVNLKTKNEILSKEELTLQERAQSRIDFQEAKKQANIEEIIYITSQELKSEGSVGSEPVQEDWIDRFFKLAAEITDRDMKALWGKILAGEIKAPKSYSLRTLEILKNMSKEEAQIFLKFGNLAIETDYGTFILLFYNEKLLEDKYELEVDEKLVLDELGLLSPSDLTFGLPKAKVDVEKILYIGNKVVRIYKEKNLPL